jgi:hypothetical protein
VLVVWVPEPKPKMLRVDLQPRIRKEESQVLVGFQDKAQLNKEHRADRSPDRPKVKSVQPLLVKAQLGVVSKVLNRR